MRASASVAVVFLAACGLDQQQPDLGGTYAGQATFQGMADSCPTVDWIQPLQLRFEPGEDLGDGRRRLLVTDDEAGRTLSGTIDAGGWFNVLHQWSVIQGDETFYQADGMTDGRQVRISWSEAGTISGKECWRVKIATLERTGEGT